jgi:hypothetical protein
MPPFDRAVAFMARALDQSATTLERRAAYFAYERECWFEAVSQRGFPLLAVPAEYAESVRFRTFTFFEGGISGLRVRP